MKLNVVISIVLLMLASLPNAVELKRRRKSYLKKRPEPEFVMPTEGVNLSLKLKKQFLKKFGAITMDMSNYEVNRETLDMTKYEVNREDKLQNICMLTVNNLSIPEISVNPDVDSFEEIVLEISGVKLEGKAIMKKKQYCIFTKNEEDNLKLSLDLTIKFSFAKQVFSLVSVKLMNLEVESSWNTFKESLFWMLEIFFKTDLVKTKIQSMIKSYFNDYTINFTTEVISFKSSVQSLEMNGDELSINLLAVFTGVSTPDKFSNQDKYSILSGKRDSNLVAIPEQLLNSDLVMVMDDSVLLFAVHAFSSLVFPDNKMKPQDNRMVLFNENDITLFLSYSSAFFTNEIQISFRLFLKDGKTDFEITNSDSLAWKLVGGLLGMNFFKDSVKEIVSKCEHYFSTQIIAPALKNFALDDHTILESKIMYSNRKIFYAVSLGKQNS